MLEKDSSFSCALWNESRLEDSASDKLDKYSWTRASRKLNTLSSSEVILRGVKPTEDQEAEPSPLLAVRIDELPTQMQQTEHNSKIRRLPSLLNMGGFIPEELDEKLLEVEMLLASLDDRLALRRWASLALHTSYSKYKC